MKTKIKFLLIVLIIILLLPDTNEVLAKDTNGANIAYSPVTEYLTLNPGEAMSGDIRITNSGDTYMEYEVKVLPFTSIEDSPGVPRPLSEQEASMYPYNAASWFDISIKSFALDPLSIKEFQYEINVPFDAEPGGHYAGIFLRDVSSRNGDEDSSLGFTLIGGPIFLITIPGEVVEKVNVVAFKSEKRLYEYLPASLLTTVANTGNVHVVPRGEIEITNMFGDKVATIKVNEEKYNVLPDKTNIFVSGWDSKDRFITVDKKILLGKMNAKLVLLYRSEDPGLDYITLHTSFWILPWKLIFLILALISLTSLIILYKKWREDKVKN